MLILFVATLPVLLVAVTNSVYVFPATVGALTVAESNNVVELIPNPVPTIVALVALVTFQLNLTAAPGATVPLGADERNMKGMIADVDDTAMEIT
jgi:hypothetical protein